MRTGSIALLVTVLSIALPARAAPPAEGLEIEVKEWRLKNGMRVLYSPHRKVPAASVQVWYHAGSKDERPGIRGIAHMFEHMMFKGSQHVPPEEHARLLSSVGGSVNAFTAFDLTAYHNTLPAQYMDFAMRLEAERMRNLHLTPGTVASEREVVKEEIRMRLENNPVGRAMEAIHSMAFTRHPYAWTPGGTIEDLNKMQLPDCQAFYDTHYLPNNATLVVVGDVDEARVRQEAERHFGGIPAGKQPPRVTVTEPPQKKQQTRDADWPSQLKVVLGSYHTPAASHPDMPALRVMSYILSTGNSSRLHQALVRKAKLAVAAGGFARQMEHPGLFLIYAVGLPNQDLDKMQQALLKQVERVATAGVTSAEVAKARNQMSTRLLEGLQTAGGVAYRLGLSTYVRGDPRAFLKDVAALDKVTAADVKRVAAAYLKRSNLTLVLLGRAPAQKSTGGAK